MSECKNCNGHGGIHVNAKWHPCASCSGESPTDPRDTELTTLRQQLAAMARECEAWRNAYARYEAQHEGCCGDDIGYFTGVSDKITDATDALIPNLTTIAGGST